MAGNSCGRRIRIPQTSEPVGATLAVMRLRRVKRVGPGEASSVGLGESAKLPDYMLDFDSWRTHRAETASARDAENIEPAPTESPPLDGPDR